MLDWDELLVDLPERECELSVLRLARDRRLEAQSVHLSWGGGVGLSMLIAHARYRRGVVAVALTAIAFGALATVASFFACLLLAATLAALAQQTLP
jgi:hypothetical protein